MMMRIRIRIMFIKGGRGLGKLGVMLLGACQYRRMAG